MPLDWSQLTNPVLPQRQPVTMGVQGGMPLPGLTPLAAPPPPPEKGGSGLSKLTDAVTTQFAPKKKPQGASQDSPLKKPMSFGSPMGGDTA